MYIRKPIDIIRQVLANRGFDDLSPEIIDALEACGWRFIFSH